MKKRKYVSAAKIAKHYATGGETKIKYQCIDWGEPSCWACGFYRNASRIDYRGDTSGEGWYKCWNRAAKDFLEKCHVVPHALTGDDSPGNFVLLCTDCHKESPDTDSPAQFQKWLEHKQNSQPTGGYHPMTTALEEVKKAMEMQGVTREMCESIMTEDGSSFTHEFEQFYDENTVLVAGQTNYNTWFASIASFLEEKP